MTPDNSFAAYVLTLILPPIVFGLVLAFFHYGRKLKTFLRDYTQLVDGDAR